MNMKGYYWHSFVGFAHAVFIYYVSVAVFQDTNILTGEGGYSVGVHGLSLTAFTAMFGIVTARIVMWTRWWTSVNFFFYSVMSVGAYVLYIWIAEHMGISAEVSEALVPLHESSIFWLTILLLVGTVVVADAAMEFYRMTYLMNGSDWVRAFMKEKNGHGWNDENEDVHVSEADLARIEEFMGPIHSKHRAEDIAREKYLEDVRTSALAVTQRSRSSS